MQYDNFAEGSSKNFLVTEAASTFKINQMLVKTHPAVSVLLFALRVFFFEMFIVLIRIQIMCICKEIYLYEIKIKMDFM